MSNKRIITISLILAIALIVGGLIYVGKIKLQPASISTTLQATLGIVVGNANAPITIEEYSNLLCSHCADFEFSVWPGIRDKYVTTGKVKFVFYIVGSYEEISKAAYCADQGGKFLDFQEYAFAHQTTLENAAGPQGDQTLFDFAQSSGLDVAKFKTCYSSSAAQKASDDWANQTSQKGVTATPTFFIDGQIINAPFTFENFDKLISDKLK